MNIFRPRDNVHFKPLNTDVYFRDSTRAFEADAALRTARTRGELWHVAKSTQQSFATYSTRRVGKAMTPVYYSLP